ncbi:MAG: hypothetical protein JF887_05765 [Candidatus Dormibacteraeota bacterium]|uniref:Phosphoesterase n=1 Tax=Candidatus Amunia macphersoniae TaxID=3127014 RepID=A0A934KJJ4_9BACT|nr:hypothetical protein [Candidatus Dormibacteraeota bacterium]
MAASASLALVSPRPAAAASSVPRYDHILVAVEENHGLRDIMGNRAAPNINFLAHQFGLATNYFGVTHPSEPNYVALLGGSTFGVQNDNPYYVNKINAPSLISQMDGAGISWKAYLQGLPHPGYQGICYPARCNGVPDIDPLYVSKHNAIGNFTTSLNAGDWSRQVPVEQLSDDLASSRVPRFSYVIPDECHDMHGDPPYCIDSGSLRDPQDQRLVTVGDAYIGRLTSQVTSAPFWSHGNNAMVIVFDEGSDAAGCCAASPGGGKVVTIVVTNHGPRGVTDATPYNHYSLLQTIQQSFGLGCLQNTCATAQVKPLAPLFAIKDTDPLATHPLSVPDIQTATPTPVEPIGSTTKTATKNGWTVIKSPMRGTADNSLGAISASTPSDIWAVGNFLPDAANSNPDATLTFATHYDGTRWTAVPTPNTGPNFNTLFGVAAKGGQAWAVGVHLTAAYQARSLIEHWDGTGWTIVDGPQLSGSRNMLLAASAVSTSNVWAVGQQQGADDRWTTLVEHWDGHTWRVVPSPNPGSSGDSLYGVAAAGPEDVWAVGQRLDGSGADQPLLEHWDGDRWTVVASPRHGTASGALYSVSSGESGVWAVGQTEDAVHASQPLVEHLDGSRWQDVSLPRVSSGFTSLWSVTVADDSVWAVGTANDPATGNDHTLAMRGQGDHWQIVNGPDPAAADENRLGAVTTAGDTIWAVGYYKDQGRKTLIERRRAE